MKIFRVVQQHYAILGVSSSHQPNQKYRLNRREVFSFFILGCLMISHFVYIFRVASGFMEYMECICSTSTCIIAAICFAAVVFRKTTLFERVGDIEQFIDASESVFKLLLVVLPILYPNIWFGFLGCKNQRSRRFFLKTNRQVERLCKFVFKAEVKFVLNFALLPKCIVSFGIYFLTDSGNESLKLPIPLW